MTESRIKVTTPKNTHTIGIGSGDNRDKDCRGVGLRGMCSAERSKYSESVRSSWFNSSLERCLKTRGVSTIR